MSDGAGLAVSNIAWEPSENDVIAALLRSEGVHGIEIAPTKWRDDPLDATGRDIAAYRRSWEDRGLKIVSLQALLFGRPDLQLFGSTRPALADFLKRMIDFGAALGTDALVFGSPKNRVRGQLPIATASGIAVELFREIGDYALERDVVLCIEANPPAYGCDFITTTAEAVALCEAIDHRGIGINGDLGGMTMSGEAPDLAIRSAARFLGHFHASEPELAELGIETSGVGSGANHRRAANGLAAIGYRGCVSIEMRSAGGAGVGGTGEAAASNVARVGRAVKLAKRGYEIVLKERGAAATSAPVIPDSPE